MDAGATSRPGVREEFMPWLERHHPDLVERYETLYGRADAAPDERRRMDRQVRVSSRLPDGDGQSAPSTTPRRPVEARRLLRRRLRLTRNSSDGRPAERHPALVSQFNETIATFSAVAKAVHAR